MARNRRVFATRHTRAHPCWVFFLGVVPDKTLPSARRLAAIGVRRDHFLMGLARYGFIRLIAVNAALGSLPRPRFVSAPAIWPIYRRGLVTCP
ncbi:hypothetical protein [Robbsia andropogonis]|nr:hypothetical protein [Robbsia andropogonis]